MNSLIRCDWVTQDSLYQQYHDMEWGKPIYNDRLLFEALCLESQQAGLSWLTVLKKREGYRRHFDNFNPQSIAQFGDMEITNLLLTTDVIRHRKKLQAIVSNAQAYLKLQEQGINFTDFIWSFVNGVPIVNNFDKQQQIPTTTALSDKMAYELKKRGFCFMGSVSCYAFMQAVGLVNDHFTYCHCRL